MEKEWGIESSLKRCASCGKEFQEEEQYFSEIYDSDGGFLRKDFCPACWKGPDEKSYSFWKTRVPPKEQKPEKFIDLDVIFDFFEKIGGAVEREKENFRFILALVLMRKRKLKLESSKREEGQEFLILRETGTKNTFHVKNPGMAEEEVENVTEKVGQILNMDL